MALYALHRDVLDTTTSTRSQLRELHTKEPRNSDMDATRIDYPRTIAGCVAVIVLLMLGAVLGRCSAPAAAQGTQPPLTLDEEITLGNDHTVAAQAAIADLERFLQSTTTTSPPSAAAPKADPAAPVTPSGDRWDQLAQCETGGDWSTSTGNGYGGGLQFAHSAIWSTWLTYGGGTYAANPWDASREEQIAVAENVLASSGWRAWPGCARKMGLL